MKYAVLSSGSDGNATLVCGEEARILIDCGLTKSKLTKTLAQVGIGLGDVDNLLITHAHNDHIAGIRFIPQEKWLTSPGVVEEELGEDQYFSPYQEFQIKDLSITPLPLSHDAANTVGFLIKDKDESLVYITDTGYIKEKVLKLIKDATYYIFESNHDTKMLYTSDRSAYLIRRIHSDKGHMDNVESATYLSGLIGKETKEVTLAHLSEECNKPEIALETFNRVMISELGSTPEVLVRCASIENVVTGGNWERKI
jgi:phosphoribosyl 1,2-cyclic phosphodiesterase